MKTMTNTALKQLVCYTDDVPTELLPIVLLELGKGLHRDDEYAVLLCLIGYAERGLDMPEPIVMQLIERNLVSDDEELVEAAAHLMGILATYPQSAVLFVSNLRLLVIAYNVLNSNVRCARKTLEIALSALILQLFHNLPIGVKTSPSLSLLQQFTLNVNKRTAVACLLLRQEVSGYDEAIAQCLRVENENVQLRLIDILKDKECGPETCDALLSVLTESSELGIIMMKSKIFSIIKQSSRGSLTLGSSLRIIKVLLKLKLDPEDIALLRVLAATPEDDEELAYDQKLLDLLLSSLENGNDDIRSIVCSLLVMLSGSGKYQEKISSTEVLPSILNLLLSYAQNKEKHTESIRAMYNIIKLLGNVASKLLKLGDLLTKVNYSDCIESCLAEIGALVADKGANEDNIILDIIVAIREVATLESGATYIYNHRGSMASILHCLSPETTAILSAKLGPNTNLFAKLLANRTAQILELLPLTPRDLLDNMLVDPILAYICNISYTDTQGQELDMSNTFEMSGSRRSLTRTRNSLFGSEYNRTRQDYSMDDILNDTVTKILALFTKLINQDNAIIEKLIPSLFMPICKMCTTFPTLKELVDLIILLFSDTKHIEQINAPQLLAAMASLCDIPNQEHQLELLKILPLFVKQYAYYLAESPSLVTLAVTELSSFVGLLFEENTVPEDKSLAENATVLLRSVSECKASIRLIGSIEGIYSITAALVVALLSTEVEQAQQGTCSKMLKNIACFDANTLIAKQNKAMLGDTENKFSLDSLLLLCGFSRVVQGKVEPVETNDLISSKCRAKALKALKEVSDCDWALARLTDVSTLDVYARVIMLDLKTRQVEDPSLAQTFEDSNISAVLGILNNTILQPQMKTPAKQVPYTPMLNKVLCELLPYSMASEIPVVVTLLSVYATIMPQLLVSIELDGPDKSIVSVCLQLLARILGDTTKDDKRGMRYCFVPVLKISNTKSISLLCQELVSIICRCGIAPFELNQLIICVIRTLTCSIATFQTVASLLQLLLTVCTNSQAALEVAQCTELMELLLNVIVPSAQSDENEGFILILVRLLPTLAKHPECRAHLLDVVGMVEALSILLLSTSNEIRDEAAECVSYVTSENSQAQSIATSLVPAIEHVARGIIEVLSITESIDEGLVMNLITASTNIIENKCCALEAFPQVQILCNLLEKHQNPQIVLCVLHFNSLRQK